MNLKEKVLFQALRGRGVAPVLSGVLFPESRIAPPPNGTPNPADRFTPSKPDENLIIPRPSPTLPPLEVTPLFKISAGTRIAAVAAGSDSTIAVAPATKRQTIGKLLFFDASDLVLGGSNKPRAEVTLNRSVISLKCLGELFLVSHAEGISLAEPRTARIAWEKQDVSYIVSPEISAQKQSFASVDTRGNLVWSSINDGKTQWKKKPDGKDVLWVKFMPDGTLITGTHDSIYQLDQDGRILTGSTHSFYFPPGVSPDGRSLAGVASGGILRVLNNDFTLQWDTPLGGKASFSPVYSPTNKTLLVGITTAETRHKFRDDHGLRRQGEIMIFDLEKEERTHPTILKTGSVPFAPNFDPTGATFAIARGNSACLADFTGETLSTNFGKESLLSSPFFLDYAGRQILLFARKNGEVAGVEIKRPEILSA